MTQFCRNINGDEIFWSTRLNRSNIRRSTAWSWRPWKRFSYRKGRPYSPRTRCPYSSSMFEHIIASQPGFDIPIFHSYMFGSTLSVSLITTETISSEEMPQRRHALSTLSPSNTLNFSIYLFDSIVIWLVLPYLSLSIPDTGYRPLYFYMLRAWRFRLAFLNLLTLRCLRTKLQSITGVFCSLVLLGFTYTARQRMFMTRPLGYIMGRGERCVCIYVCLCTY